MRTTHSVRTITFVGCLLQLGAFGSHALGAAGDVDLSFDSVPPTGTSVGPVRSIAVQPDGKSIVAGGSIARANPDGTRDTSFVVTQDSEMGHILAIALQADGKVVVGHVHGIARLNSNGSPDTNFNAPLIFGNSLSWAPVHATAVQSDGKILIGGDFRVVNGEIRSSIARLNSDGSVDSTFNPDTSGQQFSVVFSIVVQPNGKVVIGGQYMTVRNDSVARLNADGSLDDANFFSARPFETVKSVALQPDGKLVVGGGSSGGIVRLNVNGSLDASFNPGTGTDRGVFAVALQPDGKVLIGGDFRTFSGTSRSGIARLNTDGTVDASFDPGTGASGIPPGGGDVGVSSIALQPDGNVLVGGIFAVFNGVVRPYLARLYGDSLPSLAIARSGNSVIVSWPSSSTGFELQHSADLEPATWTTPSEAITDNGTTKSITARLAPGNRFFRLFMP